MFLIFSALGSHFFSFFRKGLCGIGWVCYTKFPDCSLLSGGFPLCTLGRNALTCVTCSLVAKDLNRLRRQRQEKCDEQKAFSIDGKEAWDDGDLR